MARPLRLEFPGALYHVMSRGQERAPVFRRDADCEGFLELLGSIVSDEGWLLHAYCLLGNHYHLLVETPRGRLSAGMRSLNGRYTQQFNRRHGRSGHLFEGRYKAILVSRETYLLELCRYVVLNPVRAGLVKGPGAWPWSNYRETAGRIAAPEWLEVDWTLSQFAKTRSVARLRYRRFVAAGKGLASPLDAVRGQIYLGDDEFLGEVDSLIESQRDENEIPLAQRRPKAVALEKVRSAVAREWGVAPDMLGRRRGGEDKIAAIYLARKLTGLRGREVGAAFGVRLARVSNVVTEVERSGERRTLRARIEKLRRRLEQSV